MPHILTLIIWGELGVLILFGANIYRRWRNQETQKTEIKFIVGEHFFYCAICAVVIIILNESGASPAAKELLGLKSGDLTEIYCFSSVGLSIASITKNILGAALA